MESRRFGLPLPQTNDIRPASLKNMVIFYTFPTCYDMCMLKESCFPCKFFPWWVVRDFSEHVIISPVMGRDGYKSKHMGVAFPKKDNLWEGMQYMSFCVICCLFWCSSIRMKKSSQLYTFAIRNIQVHIVSHQPLRIGDCSTGRSVMNVWCILAKVKVVFRS